MGIWWCKNLRFVSWFSRWACRFSRWACRFLHNILFHILPIFVWLPDSRTKENKKKSPNHRFLWAKTLSFREVQTPTPTIPTFKAPRSITPSLELSLAVQFGGSTPQKKRSFSAQDSGKTRMTTLDSQTSAPWFITIPDITLKRTWWRWNWWDVHTQLGYEWFVIYLPPCGPPNTGLYLLDLLPDESETCNQWQSNI